MYYLVLTSYFLSMSLVSFAPLFCIPIVKWYPHSLIFELTLLQIGMGLGASRFVFLLPFLFLNSWGFHSPRVVCSFRKAKLEGALSSQKDDRIPDVRVADKEAVSYILGKVSSLLKSTSPSESPGVTTETISGEFDKIFEKIRSDSDISVEAKERMALELNIALNSIEGILMFMT